MSRYRSFVLPDHISFEAAVHAARGRDFEQVKIEHQVVADTRAAPIVLERWIIDASGTVTHEHPDQLGEGRSGERTHDVLDRQ